MYLSVAIGTVTFDQSEYTVDEGTSEVQICLTARGYGFSVIIETEAATATGRHLSQCAVAISVAYKIIQCSILKYFCAYYRQELSYSG